jgi:hypothetical protein
LVRDEQPWLEDEGRAFFVLGDDGSAEKGHRVSWRSLDDGSPHGRRQVSMKYRQRVSRGCLEREIGDDVAEYRDAMVTRDDFRQVRVSGWESPTSCMVYLVLIALYIGGPCLPLYKPGRQGYKEIV